MQVRPPSPALRLRPWLAGALILGLALCCYWPALHGSLVWDDEAHVTRPELRSLAGLRRIWFELGATQQYYPILHSAFWIEHTVWGDAPLGYHLVNVLLHAAAAGLLILLLRRLAIPGAGLAGLIFVAHPVCVESVAWISEQKNTLSLVFYLLAALAYVRFDRARSAAAKPRQQATRFYVLATALFVLALLTKTVTATLPAALLVVAWWQRGRLSWRRDVRPLLPWFAAALASGFLTAWVERKLIGAEGAGFDLSPGQRALLAGRVIWFYLGKLLWPARLVFVYPRWDVKSAAAGWAGDLAAAAAVTAALWLFRRRWRGPLAAWLFFVGSLFPALGFVNVYPFIFSYVADHFQYLASLGVITAFSAGVALLSHRATAALRAAAWGGCGLLVATLGVLSRAQSRTYGDLPTLYATTLERNPNCWMAHYNLGILLAAAGRLDQAVSHFQTTLKIKPDYAEARVNWGGVLLREGRFEDAADEFQRALALEPRNAEALCDWGIVLAKMGRRDEAEAKFEEALRGTRGGSPVHANYGEFLVQTGRLPRALAEYEEALRLDPDDAEAHFGYGNALAESGRIQPAMDQYAEALRRRPGSAEAHNNLGNLLAGARRFPEALAQFQEAVRLEPANARFHANLGKVLAQSGRRDEAIAQFEAALRLDSGLPQVRAYLSRLQEERSVLR